MYVMMLSRNELTDVCKDLVDLSAHAKENDNITFLLTCIDVFSKYAWA